MRNLKVAVAQFEPKDGAKAYNLSVIEELTAKAKARGAEVISFHELSVTAYTFLKDLTREEVVALAENVPDGPSTGHLIRLAQQYDIIILAGLVEIEDDKLYNTYVCVDKNGFIAKHRKIHPFISPYLEAGAAYTVFDLKGWKCGILICYDNNVVENVRATALWGQRSSSPRTSPCARPRPCRAGAMWPTRCGRPGTPTRCRSAWSSTGPKAAGG